MALQCEICPKGCILNDNQRGDCQVRVNLDGKIRALTYGYPCSIHVDPIEKKPLFHFFPGAKTLSLATAGCNLHCKNCQNWEISQSLPEDITAYKMSPSDIIALTLKENSPIISYTYTDPVAFYEYTYDIAVLAKQQGIKNVLVTAGYCNQEPLKKLFAVTDAAHIDLKFFDDNLYQKITSGTLKPVLDALILAKKMDVWVEIINLVIPTLSDDLIMIKNMCKWIKDNLGLDTPIHFSRFYPQYLLKNLPPTPTDTLKAAYDIAKEVGLHYVYIGNVWGDVAESTYCPYDGKLIIRRTGYEVLENNIKDGKCKFCGNAIAGRW